MKASISIFLLFSTLAVSSQTKTFVGIKAGGGASTAYMQHSLVPVVFDIGWLPGATYGLQVTHFPEKFGSRVNAAIQFSVNYVQKGWLQKFTDTSDPNHTTRINVVEFPVEAVGYFGNKNKYYLSAGFFVSYVLSDRVDPVPTSAVESTEYPSLYEVGQSHFYRYDLNRDTRLNYGPRGAAGVFRETDIGIFRLEAFFTFSIRGVFDYEPIESAIPDLALSYGAGVTLGYMFSFGKLSLTDP